METRLSAPRPIAHRSLGVAAFAFLALAVVASACGLYRDEKAGGTPTPGHANAVQDGGFEDRTPAGWQAAPGTDFGFTANEAHSGAQSASLRMQGADAASIAQQLNAAPFPEYVSGFYRLDGTNPAPGFGTLAFVVTVAGGDFSDGAGPHTVRFMIGGMQAAPANAGADVAYVFLSRAAPSAGAWTYFGYPVAQAFAHAFGKVPTRWTSLQLLLSAEPGSGTAYFDDLYAGSQRDNPNRPPQE